MKAILDTRIFLWWNIDDPQLSISLRDIISDGNNVLFFSAASAWEIAIKAGLDRLTLPESPGKYVANRLTLHQFQSMPVMISHALNVYHLPSFHRDPFDRLIISQGQLEDIPILTADPIFTQYDVKSIY